MLPIPVPAGPKQLEQSRLTRERLVRAARELFGELGYTQTSIADVARAAGVPAGALHHHFADERALFRAVYEELARELAERLTAAAATEPRAELHLAVGCQAFLDACVDPALRRILILDAPAVLGVETRDQINAQHARGLLTLALTVAMDAGYLRRRAVEPLAYLLLGALEEAALRMARAEDVTSARSELGQSLQAVLDGLRA
jgi:AcrR family transcriptional regulator